MNEVFLRWSSICISIFILLVITGCQESVGPSFVTPSVVPSKSPFDFKYYQPNIPVLSSGNSRIFFYRPQRILGSAGIHVVAINDILMGEEGNLRKSLLAPGAVFIADSPVQDIKISLYQNKKEEMKLLNLSLEKGESIYLRLKLKPTSGYLEIIDRDIAEKEIQSLKFTGYFILSNDIKEISHIPVYLIRYP